MRKADFKARIKKIEIVNKVLAEDWEQSIKVILDEIELNDENLLELRQFKPNEMVSVEIKPVQVSLFDNSLPKEKLLIQTCRSRARQSSGWLSPGRRESEKMSRLYILRKKI